VLSLESDVRAAALACVEAFTNILKENDAKLVKEAAAAAAAAGAAAPAGAGGVTAGSGGSMLGWAMSSLAASSAAWVGGSTGSTTAAAARPAAEAAAVGAPAAAAAVGRQAVGTASKLQQPQPETKLGVGASGNDGWDEDLDDEDDIMDKEEQEVGRNRGNGS